METAGRLIESARAGDRRALARLLSRVEAGGQPAEDALDALHPFAGNAHIIGITGAPGSGKSTLAAALTRAYRMGESPCTVAVLAVDPSSPFSGGALLGDRVRMRDLAGDPGVFIRSMASRGAVGGLAEAAEGAMRTLDAAGFDVVLVETVGAGQAEVEIARHAHSVVVVEAPGLGDDIQALKAGILEIADVIALNKGDLPGAADAARALRGMLELGVPRDPDWRVQVLETSARGGEGVAALAAELRRHREHLAATGRWQRRAEEVVRRELEARLRERLMDAWTAHAPAGALEEALRRVQAREITPSEAVAELVTKHRE